MMNTVLDFAPPILHVENKFQFDFNTLATDSPYTTAPIVAIKPLYQQPNEEELHTSFEQAISSRQIAVQYRLSRLSALNVPCATRSTEPLSLDQIKHSTARAATKNLQQPIARGITFKQRTTILICLMVMLLTLFFDFASLLICHMH